MPKINDMSVDEMHIHSITRRSNGSLNGPIDAWQLVALYEILVELRRLNNLLHCHNFVAIPRVLRGIERNTKPKKRKRAKPKHPVRHG